MAAIMTNIAGLNGGTVFLLKVNIRLVICEQRMMNSEFWAAVLLCIEKKKLKNTKLNGPPPIPRNEDKTPSKPPTVRQTPILFTRCVAIRDLKTV